MKKALQTSVLMSLVIIPMFFAFAAQAADLDTPKASTELWGQELKIKRIQETYCAGNKANSLQCKLQMGALGEGTCSMFKTAKDALDKFEEVCSEAKYEGKQCIQKAAACANQAEDEEGDLAKVNETNKLLGLPLEENNSELTAKCSAYNLKDYDTRKSDLSKELRDAQKDLEATQKDVAKNAQEYSGDKRKQIERQSKIQESLSKLIDSNQKEAQDRAQEMSKSIMDSEKEQSQVRVQNIQAQGEIAKIQAARAQQLSRLTDAMISTDCMTKMDLLLRKWALEGPKTLNGAATLFQSNADKKRRIQDEHRACIEEGNAARKSARKLYASQVQAVRDQIKSNDQQAARLEEQKGRQASDYQAFLARQGASTNEAYARAQSDLQAMQKEAAEIEQSRAQRNQEVALNIEENRKRINEATQAMANLGTRPRGNKTPDDGYVHFKKFMRILEIYRKDSDCKDVGNEMARIAREEIAAYEGVKNTGTPTTPKTSPSPTGSPSRAR